MLDFDSVLASGTGIDESDDGMYIAVTGIKGECVMIKPSE